MTLSLHFTFFSGAGIALHFGLGGILFDATCGCGTAACHLSFHLLGLELGAVFYHAHPISEEIR